MVVSLSPRPSTRWIRVVRCSAKLAGANVTVPRYGNLCSTVYGACMKTAILDSLKTDADLILGDLAKDHDPVLITDDGRPAAYLIDAADYEAQQDRLRILEGIARGEQALASGLVFSHADAKARMARWLS